jgi:hypothetical protein
LVVTTAEIQPGLDLAAFAREHRVRFVRKDRSGLMRFIGWLLGIFGYSRFMASAWTTVGRTVYFPTGNKWFASVSGGPQEVLECAAEVLQLDAYKEYLEVNRPTVEHEFHHILQFARLWHLHSLLYLLGLPLPFGLAWYRWRCERVAYLHQIRHYALLPGATAMHWEAEVEHVVGVLWRVYGRCWPRSWMRRWFLKQLENVDA